jgi:drug/metabolite transporter (DMT)-like permease
MRTQGSTGHLVDASHPYSLGLLLVAFSGLTFASVGIGNKIAVLGGANAMTITLGRYAIAATVLWLLLPMLGYQMRLPRRQAISLVLMGMSAQSLVALSYAAALQYLSLSVTELIVYLYPAMVVAMAVLTGRERLTPALTASVALALGGCVLVIGTPEGGPVHPLGAALALCAAVGSAAYLLLGDRLLGKAEPLVALAHVEGGTAIVMVVLSAFSGAVDFNISTAAGAAIVLPALIGNILAKTAMLAGVRRVGPSSTGIASVLELFAVVVAGGVLFSERLGATQLLGGLLIVAALGLIRRQGHRIVPPEDAIPIPAGTIAVGDAKH